MPNRSLGPLLMIRSCLWAVSLAVVGAGAAASIPLTGLELVTGSSGDSTTNPQMFEVFCPGGKVVVGGGARITGGISVNDDIVLIQSQPNGDPPDRWSALGRDLVSSGASWGLSIQVWCASPPPGYVHLSAVDSLGLAMSTYRSVLLECPAGTELLGTGIGVFGTALEAVPRRFYPQDPDFGTWEFHAENFEPDQGSWLLRGDLLCADVSPGPRIFRNHTISQMAEVGTEVFCPPGWVPLTAGFDLTSGPPSTLRIRSSMPLFTSLGDYATNWYLVLSGVPLPPSSSWQLQQWTVCHVDPIFADALESGDLSAWSDSLP